MSRIHPFPKAKCDMNEGDLRSGGTPTYHSVLKGGGGLAAEKEAAEGSVIGVGAGRGGGRWL